MLFVCSPLSTAVPITNTRFAPAGVRAKLSFSRGGKLLLSFLPARASEVLRRVCCVVWFCFWLRMFCCCRESRLLALSCLLDARLSLECLVASLVLGAFACSVNTGCRLGFNHLV